MNILPSTFWRITYYILEYSISIHYDEAIIILTSIKYYKKYSKIQLLLTSSYMEGMVLYKVQILILPSSLIILLSKMWGDKLVQLSPPNMGVQAGSKECKSLYSHLLMLYHNIFHL